MQNNNSSTFNFKSTDFSPEAIARNETLFTVANGIFGLRGDFEEKKGSFHKGTYINGFYDSEPIQYGESAYGYAKNHQTIVNLPDPKRIELCVNGIELSLNENNIQNFVLNLDFLSGIMSRKFSWYLPDNSVVEITTRRLVPFTHKACAFIEYEVACINGSAKVILTSSIDTTVRNIGTEEDPRIGSKFSSHPLLLQSIYADTIHGLSFTAKTRNSALNTAGCARNCLVKKKDSGSGETITESEFSLNDGICSQIYTQVLAEGESILLTKYICYDYGTESLKLLEEKSLEGSLTLLREGFHEAAQKQKKYLSEFWKTAALTIEGDKQSEKALHFNVFHLLQSAGTDGKTSIAAKGLTAEGYEGHYFWDAEAYVCPVFTYLKRDTAVKLLEYRYSKLSQARLRAKEMNLKGALFPWRTINGEETSAYYPAGTAQYHINADIMLAFNRLLFACSSTDNSVFNHEPLFNYAVEIAIETARMWMSLGSRIESKGGKFCINEVTGPDEYTACVNNNAFTNLMARENLWNSVKLVKQYVSVFCGKKENNIPGLSSDCLLPNDQELSDWQRAADDMYIPYDKETGLYPQDDSFMHKKDWDFEGTPKDKYPLLLYYHPLVIYRHRVLKQPDLVLAQFFLSSHFSLAEKIRNFTFYEAYTTGDSSLAYCIQSIMACETGDIKKAEKYFDNTARMDIEDVHGNTKDGIHTACMAGSWMSVVYGFAGFRDHGGHYSFNPHLLPRWKTLCFKLCLHDSIIEISITKEEVCYTLLEGKRLTFFHRKTSVTLDTQNHRQSFSLVPVIEAVLFDLDGVITDTAELHYRAWKKTADEHDLLFDRIINEKLRGVSRNSSFEIILQHNNQTWPEEKKISVIEKKNEYYKELLNELSEKDVLEGIISLLEEIKSKNIKTVLVSASKNASMVCKKIGISHYFDEMVNPEEVPVMKPESDIFIKGAELAGVWYYNCICIEDAQAGIDAIRKAGICAVGIGQSLTNAHYIVDNTTSLTFKVLQEAFSKYSE